MMEMYSRVRARGRPYGTPYQPSMTWGPLGPTPRMNRPPDIASRVIAVIAAHAGARAPHLDDGRADIDARGAGEDPRGGGHRIGAPRLRRPHRIEAEVLRFEDDVHRHRHFRGRVARHQTQLHRMRSLSRSKIPAPRVTRPPPRPHGRHGTGLRGHTGVDHRQSDDRPWRFLLYRWLGSRADFRLDHDPGLRHVLELDP